MKSNSMSIKDEPKQRLPTTLIATFIVKETPLWSINVMDENAVKKTLNGPNGQEFINE